VHPWPRLIFACVHPWPRLIFAERQLRCDDLSAAQAGSSTEFGLRFTFTRGRLPSTRLIEQHRTSRTMLVALELAQPRS